MISPFQETGCEKVSFAPNDVVEPLLRPSNRIWPIDKPPCASSRAPADYRCTSYQVSSVPSPAMVSELDPLLPRNEPSPEISGTGYSRQRSSAEVTYTEASAYYHDGEDAEDAKSTASDTTSTKSALSNILSIFSTVVLFALIIAVTSDRGLGLGQLAPEPVPHPPGNATAIEQRVFKILEETPLIDGHNDLAIYLRFAYKNQIHSKTFKDRFENGGLGSNVDLPRLRTGRVGGAFWSAFVPCPVNASYDLSDSNYAEAVSTTLSQIDLISRLQAQYPKTFTPALSSPAHALDLFRASKSLVSPISIEGLHQVPPSAPMSTLRLYRRMGVRAATLTWNCHNAFADAALIPIDGETAPAPYYRGGLTSAGRAVIKEMNRLGILVDISHTSYWTQKAVLSKKTSLAPVVYTHSSAFSLCPHPRNVQDDLMNLVKETKSLIMVNFAPEFISCSPPPNSSVLPEPYEKNNTLHQVARHVMYIGEKIGYDHVGFGSDFDGIFTTPRGLEGVEKYPDLVAELLRLGVSDEDASKIVGGNILRVWQAAEDVAKKMQDDGILEGEDPVRDWGKSEF